MSKLQNVQEAIAIHAEATRLERERTLAIIDFAEQRCDLSMQDVCALIARAIREGWTVEEMGERMGEIDG